MQPQLEALKEISLFLDRFGYRHAVIGGVANAIWGQPRATLDADFKVVLGERSLNDLVQVLTQQFRSRVSDPEDFVKRTYVLPIQASNGVGVDIGIGFLGYEQKAIERAIIVQHSDVQFKVCTAEDLIIHKAISEREKDWADIEGILVRQGRRLNQDYIDHWLKQFAEALERPNLLTRYHDLRRKTE